VTLTEPSIPPCEPWNLIKKLAREKEVIGMYLSGHPLDDYKIEFNYFNVTAISRAEEFKNKDLNIAGVITDVFERMGKNNKPYGSFTLEDYSGNIRVTMWSEDFLRYKHFLTVGQMLFIKGTMKPGFRSPDQFEFKVNQIMLLAEVRERLLNKVTLTIKADKFKNGFLQQFHTLVQNHKGTAVLKLNIIDDNQKIAVNTSSTRYKINFENEMVKELEDMGVEYKLN
jgi:DNA polymerase-3 subunit alpha